MEYKVTIHFIVPCKLGGIQSKTQVHFVNEPTEEEAEKRATILGVNDPSYLYTSMVDVQRNLTT